MLISPGLIRHKSILSPYSMERGQLSDRPWSLTANKTGTSKVGAISETQKAQGF